MKLSKKDKIELRKSVEVLLNSSPDNKKIQLSNETLDQLLFDTYVVNKEKGIKVKLPVWSGDFLRKLDLSRVSFEDVSWGLLYSYIGIDNYDDYPIDDKFYDSVDDGNLDFGVNVDGRNPVCYANTNARIDFSKSFDAKNGNRIYIGACNFANVDLSNNILDKDKTIFIWASNLSNTNITLPNDVKKINVMGSNLSNLDLSELTIDAVDVVTEVNFENTDLSNTGVRISLVTDELKNFVNQYDKYLRAIREYVENNWIGCYLNGKLIKSPDEKKQSAEATRGEYEQYKSQEFANILGSIAEQMDSTGPKK